jgi:hypothetical protein
LITAVLLAATAPATASLARPRHPVVEAPPPPPPPPPAAPVGMPDQMIDDAAAYEGLMQRVAATSPSFSGPETVATALRNGAAYEPKEFLRGAIAYAAIAALKDQGFVAALRNAGNSPENRQAMVRDIELNPVYLYQFAGSDHAAGYAKAALSTAALNIIATGKLIHQAAYDVQHQAWSNETITDRPGRLSAVEAASANGIAPAPDEMPTVQKAASETEPLAIDASPVAPPYTPLVNRALQVAAIAALGEANNTAYLNLSSLIEDNLTEECLHRAKRDLFQCLAVARPNYEDIFCMGQHEMVDPGVCLARSAGADLPPEPPPPPLQTSVEHKTRPKHHAKHQA